MGEMTRTEIGVEVQVASGLRSDFQAGTRLNDYVRMAELQIASTADWRELQKHTSASLTASTASTLGSALSANFREPIGIFVTDGTSKGEVAYMSPREFFSEYPDTSIPTEGMPKNYTYINESVYWAPRADKTYTAVYLFRAWPTEGAASSTSDLDGKDMLIITLAASLVMRIYGQIPDAERAEAFYEKLLTPILPVAENRPDLDRTAGMGRKV